MFASKSAIASAKTDHVTVSGKRLAYRAFGAKGPIPLVFLMRFRGTMDHWDPAFIDPIAAERPVILLDSAGVGESEGEVPPTIAGMAEIVKDFAAAKGFSKIDVFGWSMGAAVGLKLAINHPALVRKLVFAGSGPGGVPDAPRMAEKVIQTMTKPVSSEEDFLYLFYADSDSSREAGRSSNARIEKRTNMASHKPVRPESFRTQMGALGAWGQGVDSATPALEQVQTPTLVMNGAHDVMVHAYNSFFMSQRMPNAQLILYPNAGHAFQFQYPDLVAQDTLRFLA